MPGREKSKRRRKRRIAGAAVEQAPTGELAKSKADVVREQLVPLEEGERPLAVTVAAIVAAVLVLVYLVAFAVGGGSLAAGAPFVVVLLVAGVGMWRARYWAVLGFQALLALLILVWSLFLVRAESLAGVLVAIAVIALAGTLFWFLVKALARIQMPERRPSNPDG
jgi:hypothetical protein